MDFLGTRLVVDATLGRSESAKRYEFAVRAGEDTREVLLTVGLNVTFLYVRPFTPDSVLVLYFTGNPVQPQFIVAEFAYDNQHISHLLDHGPEVESAIGDWKTRRPGDTTAALSNPDDVKASG